MAKVKKEVEVAKEVSEVGDAVLAIIKATKAALADGWQPGSDVPAILTACLSQLGAVSALSGVPADWAEDKSAVLKACALLASDLAGVLTA
jgi:hypothetical protein